ncbi:C-C motif chemokine 14-like isoform X3 [Castor canadensis]|nr:C-C motif chemokine 14 [Castor canadensis]
MKVPMATISFLLLLITINTTLGAKAEASSRGPYHPSECCFTYITHAIPHHRISSFYETSGECPKPGVVFITKKGHSICASPQDEWVQDYIKDLEEN